MIDLDVVQRTLAEALVGGGELAEVFVEDRSSTALRLDDSRIEDVTSGRDVGAGIRVLSGDRASYAFTNLLTEESLRTTARGRARRPARAPPGALRPTFDAWRAASHPVKVRPEDVGAADKAGCVAEGERDAARSLGAEGASGDRLLRRRAAEGL